MTEGQHIQVDLGGGRAANIPVDLPGNSIKDRRKPRERQEKIIEGVAVQRPPSLWHRVASAFVSSEERAEGVWPYIVVNFLIPGIKNVIWDAASGGLEHYLFGESRIRSRADRPTGRVNYTTMSGTRRAVPEFRQVTPQARAEHNFGGVIFPTRGDALDVLDRLNALVEQYGVASVEDFYDLSGITGQFTDNRWGWYDLSRAEVRHVRGGYMIVLPRTQPIE